MKSLEERFLQKVRKTKKCWIWIGSLRPDGYGHIHIGMGKSLGLAHRIAYKLYIGPIKRGLTLDHLCRKRNCVNPKHLEQVTIGENVLRGEGIGAKNARKTHCPRGHPYSKENTYVVKSNNQRKCRTCFTHR